MNKQDFLEAIQRGLAGLPREDIDRSLDFYAELIADHREDGLTEEQAVAAIGSPGDVVQQILSETSLPKLVRATIRPHRIRSGWIWVLIVLGSPVWLPLLATAALCVITVYLLLWTAVVVLAAADLSLALGGVAVLGLLPVYLPAGNGAAAAMAAGTGLAGVGAAIFLFLGCMAATKGVLRLGVFFVKHLKSWLIRKEAAQ